MSTARSGEQQLLLEQIVQRAQSKKQLSFRELVCMFPVEATVEETNQLIESLHQLGIEVLYDWEEEHTGASQQRKQDATLLTREQEVKLARRIRNGYRRKIRAALRSPKTIHHVIRAAQQVSAGHRRLWDVLSDYEGSHPDEDDQEALDRLSRVAETLKQCHGELSRLGAPQAARKKIPSRRQRIATVRGIMTKALRQLDFRETFIDELLKPLIAESTRAERALAKLHGLERELGLDRRALGDTAEIRDSEIRSLLKNRSLSREQRDEMNRRIKKAKRVFRSVANRTGLDPVDLIETGKEVRRGERESNQARQTLVEANQRLVISIARRYPRYNMDFLDLVQEGNLGLMRAADRFDPERGFRFGTYAAWWVRQSIGRLVAEQSSAVRIPPHVQESLHKVNRITRRLVLKTGREPKVEELAEYLGKSPERVKEILSAGRRPISTETRVGDEDDSARLLDFLPDPHAGPEEEADRRVQQAVLQDAMDVLSNREQDVIALRFQRGLTLQEVGDRFGITRERARQLEAQALRKLRKRLRADLLRKLIKDEPFNVCEEP